MLAFLFHEFGLTLVSFNVFGSSWTEHGPSSMKRPRAELHPGPPEYHINTVLDAGSEWMSDQPLIHMITGSSEGLDLDSKK